MNDNDRVLFLETQRRDIMDVWIGIGGIALALLVLITWWVSSGASVVSDNLPRFLMGFTALAGIGWIIFSLLATRSRFETRVTPTQFSVSYTPIGPKGRTIFIDEVQRVERVVFSYDNLPRRDPTDTWAPWGRQFEVGEYVEGVRLVLSDGHEVLISSRRSQELVKAVDEAIASAGRSPASRQASNMTATPASPAGS